MSYLAIARSALLTREKSEISPPQATPGRNERTSACEKSERSEKSPDREPDESALTLEEAERLKARIIAVVSVDPAEFDRELYDALTAQWQAFDTTSAKHDAGSGLA
jgi:hypothetical protein